MTIHLDFYVMDRDGSLYMFKTVDFRNSDVLEGYIQHGKEFGMAHISDDFPEVDDHVPAYFYDDWVAIVRGDVTEEQVLEWMS